MAASAAFNAFMKTDEAAAEFAKAGTGGGHSHEHGHTGHEHTHEHGHEHDHTHPSADCCTDSAPASADEAPAMPVATTSGGGDDMGHGHSHEHGDHASEVVALGTLSVGGAQYAIDREGHCKTGTSTLNFASRPCTFGVEALGGGSGPVTAVAWLEGDGSVDGEKVEGVDTRDLFGLRVSEKVEGVVHGAHLHFTLAWLGIRYSTPTTFVLSVDGSSGEETGKVALSVGAEPRHDGILTPLRTSAAASSSSKGAGFLELKLHDDLGDLELWLSGPGSGGAAPLDIPAETTMRVTFVNWKDDDGNDCAVELKIRNSVENEDEDEVPNMREGRTNYFIFPGETGVDASWLTGLEWRGVVQVSFVSEGVDFTCEPFVLVPHGAL